MAKMKRAPMTVFTHHGQRSTFDVAPTDVFVGFWADGTTFVHDPCDYGRIMVDVQALTADAVFPVAIMVVPRLDADMIAALPPHAVRDMLAAIQREGAH